MVSEVRLQHGANMLAMRFSKPLKVEIETFDERINFGLWQVQI